MTRWVPRLSPDGSAPELGSPACYLFILIENVNYSVLSVIRTKQKDFIFQSHKILTINSAYENVSFPINMSSGIKLSLEARIQSYVYIINAVSLTIIVPLCSPPFRQSLA